MPRERCTLRARPQVCALQLNWYQAACMHACCVGVAYGCSSTTCAVPNTSSAQYNRPHSACRHTCNGGESDCRCGRQHDMRVGCCRQHYCSVCVLLSRPSYLLHAMGTREGGETLSCFNSERSGLVQQCQCPQRNFLTLKQSSVGTRPPAYASSSDCASEGPTALDSLQIAPCESHRIFSQLSSLPRCRSSEPVLAHKMIVSQQK